MFLRHELDLLQDLVTWFGSVGQGTGAEASDPVYADCLFWGRGGGWLFQRNSCNDAEFIFVHSVLEAIKDQNPATAADRVNRYSPGPETYSGQKIAPHCPLHPCMLIWRLW